MAAPRALQISLSDAERSELTFRLRRRKMSRAATRICLLLDCPLAQH
jgi:hypothetical protein